MKFRGRRSAASARLVRFALPIIPLAWLAAVPPAAAAAERVTVSLPPATELAVEDAWRDEAGLPWRFALPEAVRLTPERDGRWDRLPGGERRWLSRYCRRYRADGGRLSVVRCEQRNRQLAHSKFPLSSS